MSKPKYDTTVARMAGNIAAALAPNYAEHYRQIDVDALAQTAVMIARAIVEELQRTKAATPESEGAP